MPSVSQTKQQIHDTIKKILKMQGQFEVEQLSSSLALEVGFKQQTILDIIELMKKSHDLKIDKYGFATPFTTEISRQEASNDSENHDKV